MKEEEKAQNEHVGGHFKRDSEKEEERVAHERYE